MDIEPSAAGEDTARRAQIGDWDGRRDIDALATDAWTQLRGQLAAQAAAPGAPGPVLDLWEQQHAATVRRRVETELSDSQIALHEAIGRLMVRPEIR